MSLKNSFKESPTKKMNSGKLKSVEVDRFRIISIT